jgi:murein L,D-transpeptidase YafK
MRRPGNSFWSLCFGSSFGARTPRSGLLYLTGLVLILTGVAGCASPPSAERLAADRVVVRKSERKLVLMNRGKVIRRYRVALGDSPYGPKRREGDERTPEGTYVLDWRNPRSNFYKAIHVSYPNARDLELARAMGVDPGGMIMIHGRPRYVRSPRVLKEYDGRDWTNGCIAVTNAEMDEIWALVRDGTPIQILP